MGAREISDFCGRLMTDLNRDEYHIKCEIFPEHRDNTYMGRFILAFSNSPDIPNIRFGYFSSYHELNKMMGEGYNSFFEDLKVKIYNRELNFI